MFVFIAFLIFSGALLAAGYMVFHVPQQQAQQVLTARLRELRMRSGSRLRAAPDLIKRDEHRGSLAVLGDFVSWIGLLRRLQEYIEQANLRYRAAEVCSLSLLLLLVSYFLFRLLLPMFFLRILLALAIGAAPVLYIVYKRNRRLKKFEEQLPDAIDLFNRAMKAGHNIHAGLETISQETPEPVRMEFRKVMEELALGSPVESALHNLGRRVPLVDVKFFVIGLILQRQTGANMVAVLENLALLVRERLNLGARLKAATAQQRFSAGLLCGMPIVVAIGFWFVKPEYITLLYTDETGSKFLTYAIISEIVGILVIRRIASPRF
ncbi:MAG: type II secretion system F family protein [Acidobacteria bacterium]|nr:type II secretion system F family protein [Acidobacteriota bacterium]MBI3282190.1 type II secretion system F family protein [Acidobacteriota bacterium]